MTPRPCRCGHSSRAHEHRRDTDRCGRCPCRTFHPPVVGTRQDRVLRAVVVVVMLVGLGAATALVATRGGVDGASATQPLNEAESPPGDPSPATQASTSRGSVSTTAAEEAPKPATVPMGTVEPTGAEQAMVATDSGSPTAVQPPAASSADPLPAGSSSAGAPVSESSPASVQGPALATPTSSPVPTTVPAPDPEQPAPNPAPSATAAELEPSDQAGADYPTAEGDHPAMPDPRPEPTSTLPVTEPAEIPEPTAHNRGGDTDQDGGDDQDRGDDQDGGQSPGNHHSGNRPSGD
ncbi:hypothetical protein SAMN05660657_05020 [Geodermatophilus amargosae]|uniref:Uncharacterized protein n=1 Tax=Geodermatophilus amargosae TaxID=1296565 RepID=A0A1I7CXQ8_9ACTN|nr:hypothetical protein SAMN05660657_05020 [Geodermatophilus amargosae]